MAKIIDLDTREYFANVLNEKLSAEQLLKNYVAYCGNISFGLQGRFCQLLARKLDMADTYRGRNDILGQYGEVRQHVLDAYAPGSSDAYYIPVTTAPEHQIVIVDESPNEYMDRSLPAPLNHNLQRSARPPLRLYRAKGRQLFVSSYAYMHYDRHDCTYWPFASSRALSRRSDDYPRVTVDRPTVVIQDQFQGDNFCHFLLDWLPRILTFVQELGSSVARDVLFIMGGERSEMHNLILNLLFANFDLTDENFYFPEKNRTTLDLLDDLYFFSDQSELRMHPLHMCHPKSRHLLEDLLAGVKVAPSASSKLYISRQDAGLRRITNEVQLVDLLAQRGYRIVKLSELNLHEQISAVAGAERIVAPHGMGLTHLVFGNNPAQVLELFHPTIGSDSYAFLAKAKNHAYDFLIGTDAADNKAGYSIDAGLLLDRL